MSWLDTELIQQQCDDLLAAAGDDKSLVHLLRLLETKHGSIVAKPDVTADDVYLLPVLVPGQTPLTVLDTTIPPGQDVLTVMKVNEALLPVSALVANKALGLNVSVEDAVKRKKAKKKTVKKEPEEDLGFTVDIEGDDALQSEEEDAEETETAKSVLKNVPIESKKDINKLVETLGGVSVLGGTHRPVSRMKKVHTMGFSDLCKSEMAAGDFLEQVTRQGEVAEGVYASKHKLEPQTLLDAEVRKKAERVRKHNEIDGWFGMKRRKISEADRAELKALELRGFTNAAQWYRGAKRESDLANADSGFYQFGVVRNGGIMDNKIGENVNLLDGPKKAKSFVKTILDNR